MSDRKFTTQSGQPRLEESYGVRELLDDYGPMSMLTRFLQGHDEEIPSMPSGLGGLGFDALGSDRDGNSSGRMKELKEAEQQEFEEIRKRRVREKLQDDTGLGAMMDAEALKGHYGAMRAGDDTLSYTQTGERVIPKPVLDKFPDLAMAVQQATASVGLDPDRFEVGNDGGVYNPDTGVQEFNHAWWHLDFDKIIDNVGEYAGKVYDSAKDTVSKEFNEFAKDPLGNDLVQSSLAGIGSGVAAKLGPKDASTSAKLLGSAMGGYGAYNAYTPPPPPLPATTPSNPLPSDYAQILASQPVGYGDKNEQANLSMTLPQLAPPAAVGAVSKPDGVNYLEEVDTRDGGKSYVDVGDKVYGGSFGSNISSGSRRADLDKGFGQKVLYID
jgi:hypothetical protein